MTKIVFKVDELLPKLVQVSQVVSQKNTIRILDFVRCSTAFDELTITASDNETWLSVSTMVSVEGGGDALFCIEASKLIATLRMLGGATVSLELDETRKIAKGNYGNGFFEMPYVDAEEFPMSVVSGELKELTMPATHLRNLLQQPLFAVSADDLHPTMTCIRLDFTNDNAVSCGTDGRILVRYTQNENNIGLGEDGINVPQKPANVISQLLSALSDDEQVDIGFNMTQFKVVAKSSFSLSTRLNTGRYPNYNAVIPQDNELLVGIKKDELVGALRRVLPFGNAKTCAVTCIFKKDGLNLSARDVDFSTHATENVPCDYFGDEFKIGFNGNQLMEAVKNINTENGEIIIALKAPERAAVVMPHSQANGCEYISMVMPMMVD